MSAMGFREPNDVLWRGVRPAHKGIQIQGHAGVSNGSATVLTISAGKNGRITTIVYSVSCSAAGNYYSIRFKKSGGGAFVTIDEETMRLISTICNAITFNPPFELAAGDYLEIYTSNASTHINASAFGWEE